MVEPVNGKLHRIPYIENITPRTFALVMAGKSSLSKGGMKSKEMRLRIRNEFNWQAITAQYLDIYAKAGEKA